MQLLRYVDIHHTLCEVYRPLPIQHRVQGKVRNENEV